MEERFTIRVVPACQAVAFGRVAVLAANPHRGGFGRAEADELAEFSFADDGRFHGM